MWDPALRVPQPTDTVLYTHRRLRTRSLKTSFGPVQIVRTGYSPRGTPGIYPLDQALALPARSFSRELQRRLAKAAEPFHESVETLADLTGVPVSQRSLEELLRILTSSIRNAPPNPRPILVVAVDGKGIRMVKPDGQARPWITRRATHQGSEANRNRMSPGIVCLNSVKTVKRRLVYKHLHCWRSIPHSIKVVAKILLKTVVLSR
jgi:hypothetical protein